MKTSAVVVLHEEVSNTLILTKRSASLRYHPGEICFPGGGWERGDDSLWMTALRELREELGIEERRVRLIKPLEPEKTIIGTIIHPWLASITNLDPYLINKQEVAEVLKLPMQEVTLARNYQNVVVCKQGYSFRCCQFVASQTHFVWGATARIMKQLSM